MRTRWTLNGTVFDLVNIHLFHDASNFTAMESVRKYLFLATHLFVCYYNLHNNTMHFIIYRTYISLTHTILQ